MNLQTLKRIKKEVGLPASAAHFTALATLALAHLLCGSVVTARADGVDDLVDKRMRERHITGLSLAIIQEGKIVKAQGYGFTDESHKTAVTPDTLFQAGSISKPVAASGALRLVREAKIPLQVKEAILHLSAHENMPEDDP